MVFSSVIFLAYFLPVFLLVYYLTPARFKNAVLLLSSIFFYAWGAPRFIFAILATTAVDFYFVKLLDRSTTEKQRRLFLVLSLCLNVGMLFYFKYCNFFIDNLNGILTAAGMKPISWLNVVLPIGISFYTFESITYVVDVYRRVHKPLNNFWEYQLYIILFPKLIAGPIVRYHQIADQITDRSAGDTIDNRLAGFYRFVIGLSKKVLIANTMALKADEIFGMPPEQVSGAMAWIGMLAYTFQIYFDFSGYTDMALGIGKMIGFRFPENFDNPYTSASVTEFWRRWHITLGSWMRNYLYIPLGGNRVDKKWRLYFNLWIVFIASGFWHGAAWTFLFWGAYHGFWLIAERLFLLRFYEKTGRVIAVPLTFLIVAVGWVFFRSETLASALHYLQNLLSFDMALPARFLDREFLFYGALAVLFSFFTCFSIGRKIQNRVYYSSYSPAGDLVAVGLCCLLFTISLASITASGFNPFIYFRF